MPFLHLWKYSVWTFLKSCEISTCRHVQYIPFKILFMACTQRVSRPDLATVQLGHCPLTVRQCKILQVAITFPELTTFRKDPSKLAHVLQNYFCFSAQGQCVTNINFFSPLMSFLPPLLSVLLTSLPLFLRPDVALHQPGHPHLHRMFGDPQGAGSPLLQDPVSHSGRTQHLRALGKSPLGLIAESPHVPCFYFFVTVWFIPFH